MIWNCREPNPSYVNCEMMGIQATAGKRKLEAVVASSAVAASNGDDSQTTIPAKAGRWAEPIVPIIHNTPVATTSTTTPTVVNTTTIPPTSEDCIARLRAVAVPGENRWQSTNNSSIASTLATTLLSEDLDDDDLDDYDDFSDDDRCGDVPYSTATPQGYQPPQRYPDFSQYQNQRQGGYYHADDPFQTQYLNRATNHPRSYYYMQAQSQQTIRCDENGKSYLELGSATPTIPQPRPPPIRCCDGPTRWCNYPCYRQRRLAVLNLSMFKLARYRQCSDPSLHRSVLICNTLRLIEREMEAEGNQIAAYQQAQQQQQQQMEAAVAASYSYEYNQYEHNLRDLNHSGRATPFPTQQMDTDSGLGDEDSSRTINWSSVLSLTSQTDLDPLNNNEFMDAEVPSEPAQPELMDEFLPSWNKTTQASTPTTTSSCSVDDNLRTGEYSGRLPGEGEWDSFMQVLVGGS